MTLQKKIANKIKEKKGVTLIGILLGALAFGILAIPMARWIIQMTQTIAANERSVAALSAQLEMQAVMEDRWHIINDMSIDQLKTATTKTTTYGKYTVKEEYAAAGKYNATTGACVAGTASGTEQLCRQVTLTVTGPEGTTPLGPVKAIRVASPSSRIANLETRVAAAENKFGDYYTKAQINSALASYATTAAVSSSLGNYYTKAQINSALASYATTAAVSSSLGDYYTKAQINNAFVKNGNSFEMSFKYENQDDSVSMPEGKALYAYLGGTKVPLSSAGGSGKPAGLEDGWVRLGSGLILQWGFSKQTYGGTDNLVYDASLHGFPIPFKKPFPNGILFCSTSTALIPPSYPSETHGWIDLVSYDKNKVVVSYSGVEGFIYPFRAFYFAIGY